MTMWRNPRLVVLTAVSAAIYSAAYLVLGPLSLHLIPGVLSFTIRAVVPLALGLLFGPAGAWGIGIGNLIGDLISGSLALGSIFGFLATFLLGYLGFKIQMGLLPLSGTTAGRGAAVRAWLSGTLLSVIVAAGAAVPLAWGLDLLGFAPFKVSAVTLFLNFLLGNMISIVLYRLVATRVATLGMTWGAIVRDNAPRIGIRWMVASCCVAIGGLGGLTTGFLLGPGLVTAVVGGFLGLILLGSAAM